MNVPLGVDDDFLLVVDGDHSGIAVWLKSTVSTALLAIILGRKGIHRRNG